MVLTVCSVDSITAEFYGYICTYYRPKNNLVEFRKYLIEPEK